MNISIYGFSLSTNSEAIVLIGRLRSMFKDQDIITIRLSINDILNKVKITSINDIDLFEKYLSLMLSNMSTIQEMTRFGKSRIYEPQNFTLMTSKKLKSSIEIISDAIDIEKEKEPLLDNNIKECLMLSDSIKLKHIEIKKITKELLKLTYPFYTKFGQNVVWSNHQLKLFEKYNVSRYLSRLRIKNIRNL
jgi:hypothetical protein